MAVVLAPGPLEAGLRLGLSRVRPGARILVELHDDADMLHERIATWPVRLGDSGLAEDWYVYCPGGEHRREHTGLWKVLRMMTNRYPDGNLTNFEDAIEDVGMTIVV